MDENYYELAILGENHTNPLSAKMEARTIREFKPEFILYEGFVDYPEEEIKDYINKFFASVSEKSEEEMSKEMKHHYILLNAMRESMSTLVGCDLSSLQEEQSNCFISEEDVLKKGEEYVERKRSNFFEINRRRELYMVDKITEYLKRGRTLAIVGGGHFNNVIEELRNKGITPTYSFYLMHTIP